MEQLRLRATREAAEGLGRPFDTFPGLFYDADQEPRGRRRGRKMLSVPHLIVIFVVALVVFGPEKLPELARNFGKVMAEFRRATSDLRSTFEGHMRDLERETETRRIAAGQPPATTAPSNSPGAAGPQPVPSAPARAIPSPVSDPPAGLANEAAVKAGVMDPMQDPYLAGFDFEMPQNPESRVESAGGPEGDKTAEPAKTSPEKVPQN